VTTLPDKSCKVSVLLASVTLFGSCLLRTSLLLVCKFVLVFGVISVSFSVLSFNVSLSILAFNFSTSSSFASSLTSLIGSKVVDIQPLSDSCSSTSSSQMSSISSSLWMSSSCSSSLMTECISFTCVWLISVLCRKLLFSVFSCFKLCVIVFISVMLHYLI